MIRPAFLVGVLAALPLVSPTIASAQGLVLDGAVTLGYGFNSIDGIPGTDLSLNGYSIDFDGNLRFSEQVSVGLGFGLNSSDLEIAATSTSLNVDVMTLSVEPQYTFTNGAYVGAYYRMNDIDLALLGPITFGIDANSYGIFGGYDFGQGHVEAFVGMTDIGDTAGLFGSDVDVTDYGISAAYDITPELEIFGTVMRSDISIAATDLHTTAFSLGAEYDLGNGIGIYGAAGQTILDLSAIGAPSDITATGLTLGASYDLAQAGSLPMVLSAEYSRTNLDLSALGLANDPTVDRFALGLTIPIGNGSSTPLNSNTRTARGDYRSALGAVLQSF